MHGNEECVKVCSLDPQLAEPTNRGEVALRAFHVWGVVLVTVSVACGCKDPASTGGKSTTRLKSQREKAAQQQQAAAEKLGMPVMITNSIGMKLALIPSGEFMMGSSESAEALRKAFGTKPEWRLFQGERPQHKVQITKAFYLGVHEVTQRQYEEVMGEDQSRFEGLSRPVERVSWEDAATFCKKLSDMANGENYRLPTEAQWEYACRAGTTTRYNSGNQLDPLYAWFRENSYTQTHPVGEKEPNAWGLYDMHGNVGEWCADWYDDEYYTRSPLQDPQGPATGSRRVMRGGSWLIEAARCRSARRSSEPWAKRYEYLGFRVALALPDEQTIAINSKGTAKCEAQPPLAKKKNVESKCVFP
ncbi:MAG: formylglycine-generating enzyme family protein [Planctomycetota bacterium]